MSTARQNDIQLVHYLRFKVNFNDPSVAAPNTQLPDGTFPLAKQTLPLGALIVGTDAIVTQAFNAGTTNVLTVGSLAGANADVISAAAEAEGAVGLTQNIPPTGAMLGPLAADTPIFAQYTQTGTPATTGAAYVVIKYVVDNDLNIGQ